MSKQTKLITKNFSNPDYTPDIQCYLRHGGYQTLRRVFTMQPSSEPNGRVISPQELIRSEIKRSGLRGRGGAGFPTGTKWEFVHQNKQDKPIYLICNADESEPGTFKDRQIIHRDPHQLLEGLAIAAFANHVHKAFIYIRGEFQQGAKILENAIQEAVQHGFLGKNILNTGYDLEVVIHRGAGAYICGEETGLIESLEGKRPYPRIKPPYFPAVYGLYGCPTIVNNVETLCAVKHIVEMGGENYARLGTPNNTGTRLVCLSGAVKKPGVYEIELGKFTLGDLIFDPEFGGGLPPNRKLKAIFPGGISSKVLRPDETFTVQLPGKTTTNTLNILDLPYDFDTLSSAGTMSGSGGIIVIDDSTNMVDVLVSVLEFFAHESCGQCTPCREGTLWMLKIAQRIQSGNATESDLDLLIELANNIGGGKTVCAFGDACAGPVQSIATKFRHEILQYLSDHTHTSKLTDKSFASA